MTVPHDPQNEIIPEDHPDTAGDLSEAVTHKPRTYTFKTRPSRFSLAADEPIDPSDTMDFSPVWEPEALAAAQGNGRFAAGERGEAGEAGEEPGGPDGEEAHDSVFDLPPLMRSQKKPRKQTSAKKERIELWKVLLAVLLCMLFAMGSYMVGRVYGASLIQEDEDQPLLAQPGEEDMPNPRQRAESSGPQILTMLVMGTDQRERYELARADTIILAVVNLTTLDIHMVSIPRDTRAQIADSDNITRINHAHAIGGPELMVQTVENLLGINIHYYVETNFQGFVSCIDILGEIDYEVERRMYFPEEGIDLMPGLQKLNGNKALQYVRWRGDPTADIGRVSRQQKFVKALLEQSMRLATIPKLPSLINELRENVVTDMTSIQMLNLAARFVDIRNLSFIGATLPGEAKTIGGAAYWIMDEADARELLTGIFSLPEPEPEPEPEGEPTLDAGSDVGLDPGLDPRSEIDPLTNARP